MEIQTLCQLAVPLEQDMFRDSHFDAPTEQHNTDYERAYHEKNLRHIYPEFMFSCLKSHVVLPLNQPQIPHFHFTVYKTIVNSLCTA